MHISLTRVPLSFLLTTPPLHRIQPASFETSSTPNLEYNTCVRYLIPTTSRPPILGTGTATIKTPRSPTHSKTHGLWNGKAPSRPLRRGAHSPSQCQCAKEGVTRKLLSPLLFISPTRLSRHRLPRTYRTGPQSTDICRQHCGPSPRLYNAEQREMDPRLDLQPRTN
jgi:hypothetical protein